MLLKEGHPGQTFYGCGYHLYYNDDFIVCQTMSDCILWVDGMYIVPQIYLYKTTEKVNKAK